ncbi:MAG: PorV/PorQ family protein [candidate division KSB1 bacterium]|nr:PorV/PorQ family protein [candidate division KSB1 bacterium]MDZ7368255.1 PorV/PorQ family protein [candidate division KSB1 bacterium]MDZ7406763.1 PorV/PorQ family protein [candidate division KSB1 bacterium]
MKKHIISLCVSSAWLLLITAIGFSQAARKPTEKRAQTGLKFLTVTTDARAGALGEAFTSLESPSSAMFFNPAGLARLEGLATIALGQVNWIADIDYVFGAAAFSPFDGRFGIFGVSIVSVDYGEFFGTIRSDTDVRGYEDVGNFTPSAFAIGLGYAKAISDKFAVGGNVKYAKQDLGSAIVGFKPDGDHVKTNYSADVAAFDFGIIYRTGFKSLNFGMNVRNFSKEIKYEEEGFQLPLTFKIGLSMNAFDLLLPGKDHHDFLVTVDAVHPRDFSEQLNFGGEYLFMKTVALRAGYSTPNDEHGFSAGAGLQKALKTYKLAIDYAYTPYGVFDNVNRITVQFAF